MMKWILALALLLNASDAWPAGGVQNGQAVNASITNAAFLFKNANDTDPFEIKLACTTASDGPSINSIQQLLNAISSYTGVSTSAAYNVVPSWTNNQVGASSNTLFTRANILTGLFDGSTGHMHTGAQGDGPPIPLSSSVTGSLKIANGGTNATSAGAGAVPNSSSSTVSTWTATPTLGISSISTGEVILESANTAYSTTVEPAPSPSPNLVLKLPPNAGTSGQVLQTDGTGVTSWTSVLSGPITIPEGGTNATSATAGTVPNASSSSASSWTATPTLGVANTTTGEVVLESANTAYSTTISPAASPSPNVTFNLPATNGSNGNSLITDGSGNTSWAIATATAKLTVSSKSSNFNAAINNAYLVTAAATATLPDATTSGYAGQSIAIINTDTSSANVTIATTSSQTVGGRASSDIVLAQYNDYILVISDGSNWQVLSKKETKVVTATSSTYSLSSLGGAGRYAQMTSNSVTLGIGTWRVYGFFSLFSGTSGSGVYISGNGGAAGFYAANGANSASAPSAISNTTLGSTSFLSDGTSVQVTGGAVNSVFQTSPVEFDMINTSSTTIYLVPFLTYATVSNSTVIAYIKAVRVW